MGGVETEFSHLEITHPLPKIEVDTKDSDEEEEEEEEDSPNPDNTMEDAVGTITDLTDDPPIESRMYRGKNVPYEDTYDSDGEPDVIVTGRFAKEMDAFREYRAEFLAIGGHDVTRYYIPSRTCSYFLDDLLWPVDHSPGDLFCDHCLLAVQGTTLFLNQKRGSNLEFGELVKANWAVNTHFRYYATFIATENGEKRTFQAEVFATLEGTEVEFWGLKEAASKKDGAGKD